MLMARMELQCLTGTQIHPSWKSCESTTCLSLPAWKPASYHSLTPAQIILTGPQGKNMGKKVLSFQNSSFSCLFLLFVWRFSRRYLSC